ncbi:hypothetical protein [Sphingomonas sp. PvP056]|uniref:hypothetical protein n=1 Tax=Sphingomonas sp. PvP056 TaxID=3156392 RepID=UPI00339B3238
MTEAFVRFEYAPSVNRISMQAWRWGKPLTFQVSLDTLEQMFGLIGDRTPSQVVEANRGSLNEAATRKVQGALERPSEPVILDPGDF